LDSAWFGQGAQLKQQAMTQALALLQYSFLSLVFYPRLYPQLYQHLCPRIEFPLITSRPGRLRLVGAFCFGVRYETKTLWSGYSSGFYRRFIP
ncbi:MAG: hypothetical protein ACRCXB_05490, partial [Aeromonadaceae bacterium]